MVSIFVQAQWTASMNTNVIRAQCENMWLERFVRVTLHWTKSEDRVFCWETMNGKFDNSLAKVILE